MVRQASVERKTGETNIAVTLNLDVAPGEKQAINVSTGVGFLDHVSIPGLRRSGSPAQRRDDTPKAVTRLGFRRRRLSTFPGLPGTPFLEPAGS